jgi:hypothetical protein
MHHEVAASRLVYRARGSNRIDASSKKRSGEDCVGTVVLKCALFCARSVGEFLDYLEKFFPVCRLRIRWSTVSRRLKKCRWLRTFYATRLVPMISAEGRSNKAYGCHKEYAQQIDKFLGTLTLVIRIEKESLQRNTTNGYRVTRV